MSRTPREEQVDFGLLLDASPDALLVVLPDAPRFTVVATTRTFRAARGEDADVVGRGIDEIGVDELGVDPRDGDTASLRGSLERVVATRGPQEMPVRRVVERAPDGAGDVRYVRPVNVPVLSATGDLRYIVHRTRDVTDLHRAQQELEAARRELDAFGYSVSHDLRAPLRAIDGFSRALAEDYAETLDGAAREHLQRIGKGVSRMTTLIEQLLGLSRITRAPLRIEPVDLSALAAGVIAALRRAQPDRPVAVEIADGLVAHGDRSLLESALSHVLGNAWKFTGKTPEPTIELRARQTDEGSAFFVRDNGVGFDMKYASRLFAPFQRLHSDKEFDGAGIGLATFQRVVARHGGRVWAEAAVGRGATFYFLLPRPQRPRVFA